MRVGIAGTGFMGTTHAPGWLAAGAELAGFSAETLPEAEQAAGRFGGRAYPDYETMLADVDVVDICTPTHLHPPMVLKAAAAGKQIVCEKPLALTVELAREMIAACRAAGVQLLVAHVVRFFPEYALARQAVMNGQIGRPATVRLWRGSFRPKKPSGNWFLDENKSGGMMLDLMIHDFDYARWVAGDVMRVYAKKVSSAQPGAPVDYGLAVLTHTGGAISHVAGAWAYPPPTFRTRLEISGDRGMVASDSAATAPIEPLIQKEGGGAPDVGLPASPVAESPYTTQIKEFYRALTGQGPARVSAADGLAAVQIALAAVESARTGRAVELTPLAEVLR